MLHFALVFFYGWVNEKALKTSVPAQDLLGHKLVRVLKESEKLRNSVEENNNNNV